MLGLRDDEGGALLGDSHDYAPMAPVRLTVLFVGASRSRPVVSHVANAMGRAVTHLLLLASVPLWAYATAGGVTATSVRLTGMVALVAGAIFQTFSAFSGVFVRPSVRPSVCLGMSMWPAVLPRLWFVAGRHKWLVPRMISFGGIPFW